MGGRLLCAAAGAFAALLALGCAAPGSPIGVVVIRAGGIDPEADASLARAIEKELDEMGFRAVVDPEPLPDGDPADAARRRARTASAAHAVVLRTSSREEREGVLPGTALYEVALEVTVVNEDDALAPRAERIAFVAEDLRAAGAAWRFVDAWVAALAPWTAEQLYTTPQVAAAQPSEVAIEDLDGLQRLRSLESAVAARSERAQAWASFCAREAEELAALGAREGVRCHGDPCALATLLGVDAAGRAIVEETSQWPIFDIPLRDEAHWWEPPERLYALALDSGAEQVLLRSSNFYGFAAFEPGADVAAVELFGSDGTNALLAFDLADGRRRALTLYAQGEESVFSRAAPDGSGLFACLQDGGGCFWDGGAGRVAMRDFAAAELVALPEGVRVFGRLRDGGGVYALDAPGRTDGPTVRIRGDLEAFVGVHDGQLRLVTSDDRGDCALVGVDPARMAVAGTWPMPACLAFPSHLPDGRLLGTAPATGPSDPPGDDEVVVWTPGSDALVPITSGSLHEEYAFATRDGRKVVFNRRFPPPPSEFRLRSGRRVVCAADLP